MGFFDFLTNKNPTQSQQSELTDERKAECPNCHKKLSKIPGAKTKCPHCGDFMYLRTKTNNVRVVVTKDEADKIDEMWRIENGTQEEYLIEQKRFNDRKDLLRKRFGDKKPPENDVRWSLLNEELLENAKSEQWGLYRNVRFQMAEILNKENKLKDALHMYLEVCYLDLNAATNMPIDEKGNVIHDPEYFKPFDSEQKSLVPGIIERIKKIIKKLNLEKQEVRKIYLILANVQQRSTRASLSPADTFIELENEIWS